MRNLLRSSFRAHVALAFLLTFSLQTFAQSNASVQSRITAQVDETNLVVLKGNTHPLAQVKYDQGMAPDSLPAERMLLVLQRSPDQESALRTLIDGQHSKTSSNFHQWLTPEQFGQQFGVADSDIQTVTAWLQSHGFQVNRVATSKMFIEFSGSAGQIRNAFHTEIHKFVVKGEEHWANASDPSIPAALAPVVTGLNALNNFHKKPTVRPGRALPLPATSGKGTAQFAVSPCNINSSFSNPVFNNTCFGLGPADFAKIYNIPAGATGAGQTVAIIGDSDICTVGGSQTVLPAGCVADDVVAFRTMFGLGGNNTKVFVDGADPGLNSDELEAALDVEWVGAVAPNATVLFVTAGNTEVAAGIDLAAMRVVDNNLAPVLDESFGDCEADLGNGGNNFYFILWEQAAAQGITVNISTGDNASAGCDDQNTESAAGLGVNVNGLASTPFNVAVGGTDFDYTAAGYPSTFWNTTPTSGLSAKGYIPETPWNDSCGQNNGQSSLSTVGNCTGLPANKDFLLNINGGSGGQSGCALINNLNQCFGYVTPPWQSGVGVPSTGFRFLPDVSLFAAPGSVSNSFYVVCESDLTSPSPSCTTGGEFIPVGGTSASVQAFGGIMALVNQAMVTAGKTPRQGVANYELYPLFATQTGASLSCNSSASPAAGCTFNDITKGTNSVPCVSGTENCNSSTLTLTTVNSSNVPTSTPAYATTVGFDEATGIGSLNVANLLTNWVTEVGNFAPTTTTICMSLTTTVVTNCATPITIQHGTTVFVNAGVTSTGGTVNSGNVALIGTGSFPSFPPNASATAGVDHFNAITGNSDIYPVSNGITPSGASTNELVGGTYTITAHFPGVNGGTGQLFGVSDSVGIPVTVTAEPSTTTLTVLDFNLITSAFLAPGSPASIPYGGALTVRVDICSTATSVATNPPICSTTTSQEDGTGLVTITDSGPTLATLPLNSEGYTEFNSPMFNFPGNLAGVTTIPALSVGNHSLKASFPGDPSYQASTTPSATPFSLTITQAPTFSTATGPSSATANTAFAVNAFVDTTSNPFAIEGSIGAAPTGTVTFFNGSTQIGSPVPVVATFDGNGFAAAQASTMVTLTASGSITAKYSGDVNYVTSTSAVLPVTVSGSSGFTLSGTAPNPNPVTITTPGQTGMSVITATSQNGFTGTVTFTCSVAPTNLSDPPTCSFSPPNTVTFTNATTSGTVTLNVFTTAATAGLIKPPSVSPNGPMGPLLISAFATTLVVAFLLIRFPSFRRRYGFAAIAIAMLAVGFAAVGCGGGGGGGGGGGNPGTTAATYTVTVTGTSGATVSTVPVTVIVQ
jgi:hypothetical protein